MALNPSGRILVNVTGARGRRGQRGLASGPLGEGSVTSEEITNDPVEQAAILAKIGGTSGGGGGPINSARLSDRTNLADARQTGETDLQAFNRLIAAGVRRFYAPDGRGLTGGKYAVGTDPWTNASIMKPGSPDYNPSATVDDLIEAPGNIVAGLDILGDGKGKSVFLQGDFNYGFMGNARGGPSIRGVRFEGITFEGNSPAYSIPSQTFHCLALFGCTDVHVENCLFKNSPGDSVYAARGPKQGSPNHNLNVTVTYCEVDGSGGPSRNPFTHEDCIGWNITYNYVHDATTSGEPGPFDTEPVITNGTIASGTVVGTNIARVGRVNYSYNRFERCKGVIFALQYDVRLTLDYGGMYIVHGNIVEDCFSFIDSVGPPDDQNDVTRSFAAKITNNVVRRLSGPLGRLGGGLGIEITGNIFEDADLLRFGYGWGNRFTRVNRNTFIRCGRVNGFVFIINLDARYVNLDDNEYIACGRTDGLGTNAILLTQDGANEYGTPPNAIVPRIMGVSIRRGHVVNTKSNGSAGVLTHFAIHNATGGYGPGAGKGDTLFDGTAIPNADTFNPPVAFNGVTSNVGSLNGGPGGALIFDLTFPGAILGAAYEAWLTFQTPSDGAVFAYAINAYARTTSSVRVVVSTISGNFTPTNTVIYVRRKT